MTSPAVGATAHARPADNAAHGAHLPQVAAQGHHHLVVEKVGGGRKQRTAITTLTETKRIDELARMLAGQDLTVESRAHAEAMIGAVVEKNSIRYKSV